MIEPEACRTMSEVRLGVDSLDTAIVALLAKRFRFMDAAARIKERRGEVRDEARKRAVIAHARAAAAQAGAPADLIAGVYDQLVEASIAYEMERFDGRRREEHPAATD
jgi:isochorismate pyruvate lyase